MPRAAVKTRTRRGAAPKLRVEQGCFESGDELVCGIESGPLRARRTVIDA